MRIDNDEDRHSNRINPSPAITRKSMGKRRKTILAKNILLDLVEKTDPTIIGLLLSNDNLKRHFFVEVNGVLVFKLQDFRFSWTNTASIIPTQNTPIALA